MGSIWRAPRTGVSATCIRSRTKRFDIIFYVKYTNPRRNPYTPGTQRDGPLIQHRNILADHGLFDLNPGASVGFVQILDYVQSGTELECMYRMDRRS
jgi:hypothetical protein